MNFATIIKLIPTIRAAIQMAEELLPEGSGKEKLGVVLSTLESIDEAIAQYTPVITKLIATIVLGLNTLGIFKHKSK